MKKTKKILLWLFVVLAVFAYPPHSFSQIREKKVPDFQLRDLEGRLVRLSKLLASRPVLLDFWALWCQPCLKELPHLNDIQSKYGSRLWVVAINEDDASNQAKIRPFIQGKRYRFQVLLDPDHRIMQKFKLNALPTTFLLARDGRVIYMRQGYQPGDEEDLKKAIEQLLDSELEMGK
jgi:peroxiredoxin